MAHPTVTCTCGQTFMALSPIDGSTCVTCSAAAMRARTAAKRAAAREAKRIRMEGR